jgi:PhoPQ-activated pathogenicity-related protein
MIGAVHALQCQAIAGKELPEISWNHSESGGKLALTMKSNRPAAAARAWLALSATKDFRDAKWKSVELTAGDKVSHAIDVPKEGFAAMFGELEFKDLDLPYFLSSQVRIVGGDAIMAAE